MRRLSMGEGVGLIAAGLLLGNIFLAVAAGGHEGFIGEVLACLQIIWGILTLIGVGMAVVGAFWFVIQNTDWPDWML